MADTDASRTLTARGALDGYATSLSAIAGAVSVQVLPPHRHYNLRVLPGVASNTAVGAVLGVSLPGVLSWVGTPGGQTVVWLGPDEWLVIDPTGAQELEEALRESVRCSGAVVEQSGQRLSLVVRGDVRGLLAKGTALDLRPSEYPEGTALQGHLAQAVVVLLSRNRDREEQTELLVRTSFARYVADWILDAASDPLAHPAGV